MWPAAAEGRSWQDIVDFSEGGAIYTISRSRMIRMSALFSRRISFKISKSNLEVESLEAQFSFIHMLATQHFHQSTLPGER
jgi:hypothetical protein